MHYLYMIYSSVGALIASSNSFTATMAIINAKQLEQGEYSITKRLL